jgi:hypothetical protein
MERKKSKLRHKKAITKCKHFPSVLPTSGKSKSFAAFAFNIDWKTDEAKEFSPSIKMRNVKIPPAP